MERQKQNEMVWTQNRMNSRNDGESKPHIDDGGRPAATTIDREEESTIYHFFVPSWSNTLYVGVGLMFERLILPKKSFEKIHTLSNDEKWLRIKTKQANRPKSGLTMAVSTGSLGKAINNLLQFGTTSDHEKHNYVSFIAVAALQEEQLF